nr:hypothetical protein [uncultured Faecalibacillus sp.]
MKKHGKYIFFIILLLMFYGGFLFLESRIKDDGHDPVITVSQAPLQVSVNDKEDSLLNGVSAIDIEDGNITSNVYIESISPFDDQKMRTITYAVLDSDDHIARATRQLKYTDYTAPEIKITKPLCIYYLESTDSLKDYVQATSGVDGDISSKISIDKADYKGEDFAVTYSVVDSCGTKSTLTTNVTILPAMNNIQITLSDYMIKAQVGQKIRPLDYIENIELMGMSETSLIKNVKVSNNYDPTKPGVYEFIYRLEENGEIGVTKLVVVVEEGSHE